mmetsp:Transcript_10160/g.35563  ORF Transcript_10160/g.35563 Transcript_10160/m.35563 type:complete len:322 (-) Transcript_10160:538-1503(-)
MLKKTVAQLGRNLDACAGSEGQGPRRPCRARGLNAHDAAGPRDRAPAILTESLLVFLQVEPGPQCLDLLTLPFATRIDELPIHRAVDHLVLHALWISGNGAHPAMNSQCMLLANLPYGRRPVPDLHFAKASQIQASCVELSAIVWKPLGIVVELAASDSFVCLPETPTQAPHQANLLGREELVVLARRVAPEAPFGIGIHQVRPLTTSNSIAIRTVIATPPVSVLICEVENGVPQLVDGNLGRPLIHGRSSRTFGPITGTSIFFVVVNNEHLFHDALPTLVRRELQKPIEIATQEPLDAVAPIPAIRTRVVLGLCVDIPYV